jgi:hypothetical protein
MSQIVISKANNREGRGGRRKPPIVFTEHGLLMLSSVLNIQQAIQVNIQIVRIFSRLRQLLNDQTEFKFEIEEIKRHLSNHDKTWNRFLNAWIR